MEVEGLVNQRGPDGWCRESMRGGYDTRKTGRNSGIDWGQSRRRRLLVAPSQGTRRACEVGMTRGKQGALSKSTGGGAWVALLRGVNVGGKNRLPMKLLAGCFEAAGCREVRTVGASGNVLFRAGAGVARAAPGLVEERIYKECGFRTPVVLRSGEELAAVRAGNPFVAEGVEEALLHVVFLAEAPARTDRHCG